VEPVRDEASEAHLRDHQQRHRLFRLEVGLERRPR